MSKKHAENKKVNTTDTLSSSSIQEPSKPDSTKLDSVQAKDSLSAEIDTVALKKQKERAEKRQRRIDSLKVVKQERLISSNEKINKKIDKALESKSNNWSYIRSLYRQLIKNSQELKQMDKMLEYKICYGDTYISEFKSKADLKNKIVNYSDSIPSNSKWELKPEMKIKQTDLDVLNKATEYYLEAIELNLAAPDSTAISKIKESMNFVNNVNALANAKSPKNKVK